ncbi:hypothetical protein EOL96_06950 [Candidatus Saccharibacteria bacterium]|nr:hypothetical protein [Candidatus Saccharibacteria bacterium]
MDDLLEDIRQKIAAVSDGNVFEEFATFSLTSSIPGLTPVSGGGDFGRDGEAPSALLTCTIQADVIGNMTNSLNQYKKSSSGADTVYVATNQKLTNQQKDNLRKRAGEIGFNLPAIYDAPYFVNELYKDPDWRLKLLGISGELPTLSTIPINTRVSLDVPMIGRVEAIADLEKMQGDILISGQPGSGKTYIATDFANRHNGLFVISDDTTRIANELRQKTPDILLIDDVHSKEALLTNLRHMRTQLKLDFRIVGTAWASGESAIKTAMGIGDANILHLKDLTRNEMVEVIDACGLKGATNLLKREIVNQSKGKPGLAITLSTLCLAGDWEKVFNGDSLYDLVTSSFNAKLGKSVTTILSFIALGGDSGISLSKLAEVSGLSVPDVKAILDELAFGGVISSRDDGTVRVEPDALRYPLVRVLFIDGTGTLQFEDYIEQYPSKNDVIETLLVTILKGASMISDRVTPYLGDEFAAKTWAYYAALGKNEAEYVAANNRDAIVAVSEPVLAMQPEIAIRELMIAAVDDHSELNQHPNHPARVLGEWADGAKPGSNTAIKRRALLLKVASELFRNGYQDQVTIGRVIASALNPHYQSTESDPGVGLSITFIQGYLSPEEFNQMPALLDSAKALYNQLDNDEAFVEILSVADDWVYNRQNVSAEYLAAIGDTKKQLAQDLLTGLKDASKGRSLIQRRLRQLGQAIGMNLEIEVPREYEILFPYESRRPNREEALFKMQIEAVKGLAEEWAREDPVQVVERIAKYQRESGDTRTTYPNYLHHIPGMLAVAIPDENLIEWTQLLISRTTSAQFTASFADEIAKTKPQGYCGYLKTMLATETHDVGAMQAIIMRFTVTDEPELFEIAKPLFSKYDGSVNVACLRGEVPLESELFILDNVTEDAAVEICGGIDFEYSKDGDGKTMPEELREKWQRAIIEHSTINYRALGDLKHLLRKHPELALPWFEAKINKKINREQAWRLHTGDVAKGLIGILTIGDRKKLLEMLDSSNGNYSFVSVLVNQNPELYQVLVDNQAAKDFHLDPLDIFSDSWVAMAEIALKAKYTPEEVRQNSFHFNLSWSGSEYVMWQGKIADVKEHLNKTTDSVIIGLINDQVNYIEGRAAEAKEKEYLREVEGL